MICTCTHVYIGCKAWIHRLYDNPWITCLIHARKEQSLDLHKAWISLTKSWLLKVTQSTTDAQFFVVTKQHFTCRSSRGTNNFLHVCAASTIPGLGDVVSFIKYTQSLRTYAEYKIVMMMTLSHHNHTTCNTVTVYVRHTEFNYPGRVRKLITP